MPKLPAVKPREIAKFLEGNGFVLDHVSGSHHVYYTRHRNAERLSPKHNREIPKGTLMSLLRVAGFTREALIAFLHD